MFHVYILKSLMDGSHYIGYTANLHSRLIKHNTGQSQSTKRKRPWEIIYSESQPSRSLAMKREFQLKSYKGGEALAKLIKSKELEHPAVGGGIQGSNP